MPPSQRRQRRSAVSIRSHSLHIGIMSRRATRRGALFGAAGAALALRQASFAQDASPTAALPEFTRDAKITSWGFGVEETNPMAFSRVDAFKKAYPSVELTVVPEF